MNEIVNLPDARLINFIRYVNVADEKENRGWTEHEVVAEAEGRVVGFARLMYISRANFEDYYGTVLDYMANNHNWYGVGKYESPFRESRINTLTPMEIAENVYSQYMSCKERQYDSAHSRLDPIPLLTERVLKKYGRRYLYFKHFEMNKPRLDLVLISDGTAPQVKPRLQKNFCDKDWSGQGVEGLLLEECGRWMAELGLCVFQSEMEMSMSKIRNNNFYTEAWRQVEEMGLKIKLEQEPDDQDLDYDIRFEDKCSRQPRLYLDMRS